MMKHKAEFIINTKNPLLEFETWFEMARNSDNFEPSAMTLSSVNSDGMPSSRMILLKMFDHRGFCFFTSHQSPKAREITKNPKACLCFHWQKPLHRQVRIQGLVEQLGVMESESYFKTRPRGHQIGAWASPQSQKIKDRMDIEERFKKTEKEFGHGDIPCPPHWGGFRLKPLSVEFWQSREFRLHDRLKFIRRTLQSPWEISRLAP